MGAIPRPVDLSRFPSSTSTTAESLTDVQPGSLTKICGFGKQKLRYCGLPEKRPNQRTASSVGTVSFRRQTVTCLFRLEPLGIYSYLPTMEEKFGLKHGRKGLNIS